MRDGDACTTFKYTTVGALEISEEDEVDAAVVVGVPRIGSPRMIDAAEDLDYGCPDLHVQHRTLVQQQHLHNQ